MDEIIAMKKKKNQEKDYFHMKEEKYMDLHCDVKKNKSSLRKCQLKIRDKELCSTDFL